MLTHASTRLSAGRGLLGRGWPPRRPLLFPCQRPARGRSDCGSEHRRGRRRKRGGGDEGVPACAAPPPPDGTSAP
eukprot:15440021-Alexandrium_andersonii.AAC.1